MTFYSYDNNNKPYIYKPGVAKTCQPNQIKKTKTNCQARVVRGAGGGAMAAGTHTRSLYKGAPAPPSEIS